MSLLGKCHNCGKEYPQALPKFCVKCGADLTTSIGVGQDKTGLNQNEISQGLIQKRSVTIQAPRLMKKQEFKLFTSDLGLLGLFIALLMFSQSELFIWGLIGIVIIIMLRTGGKAISYMNNDKSETAIGVVILGLFLTFPFITDYFFYWFSNIIVFAIAYYFTPPREVINKYSNQKPEIILVLAEFIFISSMYLGFQFLGILVSTAIVVFFIAGTHTAIKNGLILQDLQKPTPSIRSATSSVNYQIVDRVSPNLNAEDPLPNLTNQLNDVLKKLERQVETFEIGLDRLDTQYQEIKDVIDVKLPVEIETIAENIQKNVVESRELVTFKQGFEKIKSQVNHFELERKKLIINYHDKYERIIINQLEEILEKAKDNYSEITKRVDLSQEYTIDEELSKLDQLEFKLAKLYQKLVAHEFKIKKDANDKRIQEQQEALARQELRSFKLQEIISEKVIGNLFAYIGAAFVIAGFFFLLNFTYNEFVLERFPDIASFEDAIIGITLLYLFSIFLLTVPGLILNKFGIKFDLLFPIFMSLGILFLQLSLYVQSFYFIELNAENSSFAIIGSLLAFGGYLISYKWKSQLVGLINTEFTIWVFYMSSLNELITKHFVTTGFALTLIIIILLVIYRQLWMPLAAYSLFVPVLWLFLVRENNNIWFPEYLTLGVTLANLGVVLLKKMPTSKPFSNFLATLFLIYPNIIALQFTVLLPTNNHLKTIHGTSSIIIVLTSFFILYWIYVLIEKEIVFDMNLPVSYKFKEEQIQYQSIQQKLNWLMLSSLVILLFAGYELYIREIYFPLIFFAVFLAMMSNVALVKDFEKLVKSSSILFIFVSQLFYVLNLYNPDSPTLVVALLSGIFLISFTLNFQIIAKYQNEFNLHTLTFDPYNMGILIAVLSTINYLIASFTEFESLVLFIAVVQWIFIIHSSLLKPHKAQIHRKLIHVASLAAPLTLFVSGVLRQESKFSQEAFADKVMINLPIILILSYAIYVAFKGELLTLGNIEQERLVFKDSWTNVFVSSNRIYVPQILLFILPSILVIYGKPYFFKPVENQVILSIYFLIYFLALPLLFKISDKKTEKSFSILSSLMGYFSFLLAFIGLGGAKQVYDKIIKPQVKFNPRTIIPLEWAIFLFVFVFVSSISWTFSLSKKFENLETNKLIEIPNSQSEGGL